MADTLIQTVTGLETLVQTETQETVITTVIETEVLELGIMGPPGPPGTSEVYPWHCYEFVLVADQTVFSVSQIADLNSVSFYVNGLLQARSSFTVAPTEITVTGFVPTAGDTVMIMYQ